MNQSGIISEVEKGLLGSGVRKDRVVLRGIGVSPGKADVEPEQGVESVVSGVGDLDAG